jgi:hypothetical protein
MGTKFFFNHNNVSIMLIDQKSPNFPTFSSAPILSGFAELVWGIETDESKKM